MSGHYYDGNSARYSRKPGSADRNDAGKLFVGGLSRDTGDDELRDYFSQYGSIAECMVKCDTTTGNSRGFGFVMFRDSLSVDKVLAERQHTLQGKIIDPKRAQARNNAGGGGGGGMESCRKIFVGGLDPNVDEEDIRDYFNRFGKIDLLEQPFDREKNCRKGFCFITFESTDAVEVVCANQKHHVGGRDVDVKKATPKEKMVGAPSRSPAMSAPLPPGYPQYAYPPGYASAYDYSAYYYAAQPAAAVPPSYSHPVAQYPAYQYTAAPAAPAPSTVYDYSSWYGTATSQPAVVHENGNGGAIYGRTQRPAEARYQPY